MASTLRRPFALANALKQIPKSKTTSVTARSFHQTPFRALRPQQPITNSKPSSPFVSLSKARDAFRRSYSQDSAPVTGANTGNLTQRLLYGAGIFGGTLLAINLVFNRETREDGGMPAFEREYLNETFMHTGLGIGIIGIAARALHTSGWSIRLMASSPWLVMGGGLLMSIGTMWGCMATSPDK